LSGERRQRQGVEERPPAPWGSFPLAELTVLAGLVMLGIGLASGSPPAIAVGVVLAALGGLEVSAREHFAGYRSHTTLLAGVVFVLVTGTLLYAAKLIPALAIAGGAAAFLAAFVALRRAFQRASGGYSFKAGRLGG
jgi:small neutral amino acid transporter SnatA (MarC family)